MTLPLVLSISSLLLTSATFSSPIFAARESGVSPPASRADTSALKTLTRARRRGREGRPVGWEGGREEGRGGEGRVGGEGRKEGRGGERDK